MVLEWPIAGRCWRWGPAAESLAIFHISRLSSRVDAKSFRSNEGVSEIAAQRPQAKPSQALHVGLARKPKVAWRRLSGLRVTGAFQRGHRDWKVPSTRRLESLRYQRVGLCERPTRAWGCPSWGCGSGRVGALARQRSRQSRPNSWSCPRTATRSQTCRRCASRLTARYPPLASRASGNIPVGRRSRGSSVCDS